jgi:lambda repressor-like predicted transcriptional regulator
MEPHEIKAALIGKYKTMTAAAEALDCSLKKLSHCITLHRPYFEIRKKVAFALGKPVKNVFPPSKSEQRAAA